MAFTESIVVGLHAKKEKEDQAGGHIQLDYGRWKYWNGAAEEVARERKLGELC